MGKQYISTVSASQAHKSDILAVEMTNKYTISISSDGYAKFWDNKQDEVHQPKDFVQSVFIHKSGIHAVSVYENILPSSTLKVTLIAFACFNGSIVFKYYVNDDFTTIQDFEIKDFTSKCWIPGLYRDPESKQDFFIVTKTNGTTEVYLLNITEENGSPSIVFEKSGELKSGTSSFPNSLAICPTENKKCAIGYINGDVLLFDFQTLKLVYTFHSNDLVTSRNSQSTSIPRVLAFSPGGTLLAVARDNQAAGSITLYDVLHGENVGSLAAPSHSAKSTVGGFAHQGWILGLSFDEEGKYLASCGFDKCLRMKVLLVV
ncbi:Antiviral protein Ski8-like protein, putative [Candida maltosa Xu316]|uniref:Antiviral protein Ski8-like protein, putative n=1 Tax=Candida maltosa (strain Xu316) TaxID=1245528 RepID=M3HRY2_CANMX|nr:Antiviral protein Ski8-like protein, putative [Candida maltosa Xu316]